MAEVNEQDPITGRKLPRLVNYNSQDPIKPKSTILPKLGSYNPTANIFTPAETGSTGDVGLYDYTQSGYDNPQTYVEDLPNLNTIRAENQGFGSTLMNGLGRTLTNIIPTVIGNVASILDFEDYVNQDNEVGNAVTRAMESFKQDVNQALPIYRENPEQSFNLGDSAWWIENGSSLAESIGAFAITGAGIGAAFNALGKGLGTINALANLGEAGKAAATVLSAAGLNQAESITTAMQVYDTTYKTAIQNGQDDATAKQNAADAASYSININRANIALNLTSAGAFIRSPNLTRQVRNAFTGQGAREIFKEGSQEYLEETLNYVAQKEGERSGQAAATGKNYKYDFQRSVNDALSLEGIEQGVLGFIGGAGQTGLTRVVNRINGRAAEQDAAYQNQQESIARIQGLQNAGVVPNVTNIFNSMERNVALQNQIDDAIKEGNDGQVKQLQYQLLNTQLSDALENGTVDQLESVYTDLESLTSTEAEAKGLDVDPRSPYNYKKKAGEALQLIKDVEDGYLTVANKGYVNPDEVLDTYIKGKTLNRLLTEQRIDYNNSQTQALQDKLNLDITADLNSTNPPKELTDLPSYQQYVKDKALLELTQQQVFANNEQYAKLTSSEYQNQLKADRQDILDEGLKKAEEAIKKADDAEVKKRQKEVKKKVDDSKLMSEYKSGRLRPDFDTRTGKDIIKEYNVESGVTTQKEVLNKIINSKYSNDLEKEISKKLLNITKDSDVIVSDSNLNSPGLYDSSNGIVSINFQKHGNEFNVAHSLENIIIHELVHKYTVDEYLKDGKFKKSIDDLYKVVAASNLGEFYGATEAAEMITEGMVSPEFQEMLKSIPYKNTTQSTWDKFLSILSDLLSSLGIKTNNTALDELIGLTTEQIDNNVTNIDEAPVEEESDTTIIAEPIEENLSRSESLEPEITDELYTGITPEERTTANIVVQEEVNDAQKELKQDGLVRIPQDLSATINNIKFENTTRQREVGNTIISLNVDYIETILGDVESKTNQQRIFDTFDNDGYLIINENFDSRLQSPNQFSQGDIIRIIIPTYQQMLERGTSDYSESDYNIADVDIDSFPIAFIDSNDNIIGYLPTRNNVNRRVAPEFREAELVKNRQLRETIYNNRDGNYTVKITRKSPGTLLTNNINRDLYNALGDGNKLADDVSLAIYKDSRLQTSLGTNYNNSLINKSDLQSGFIYSIVPTADKGNYIAAPMDVNRIGEENANTVLKLIQLYKASELVSRDKDLIIERKELAREIDLSNTNQFDEAISSIIYKSTTDDAYMFKMGKNKLSLGVTPDLNFTWEDVMSNIAVQNKIVNILSNRYHAVQLSKFGQKFNFWTTDDNNKLVQERYNNYFDYLNNRAVLQTNIQGFPVTGTTNEFYFTGQSVIEFSDPVLSGRTNTTQEAEIVEPLLIEESTEVAAKPKNRLNIKYKPKNRPQIEEDFNFISTIDNIDDIDRKVQELMKKCQG